jgi:DNA-binding NarL/FixJ family response regulator
MMTIAPPISVLFVDDNIQLGNALSNKLADEGFRWRGHLTRADFLRLYVQTQCPDLDVVLLDLDMPGKDPLTELADFTKQCPDVRTAIFSGHCTRELVEGAVRAGAWGYICKLDGEDSLIEGIRAITAGRFFLSPQARMTDRAD